MFRFYLIVFFFLFVFSQSAKSETEFNIKLEYPGKYTVHSKYFARLIRINPDPYLDLVLVKEDTVKIYMNKGNGLLSNKADLKIKLKAKPENIRLTVNENEQAVIRLRYSRGQEQLNLSQLYATQIKQKFSPVFSKADSLNFQPVWSWPFPINWGSNAMTAGDIDNDGRVEIISSMTDTASIEHGWIIIYESVGDNTYQHDLTIEVNFHAWFHQMRITDWDQDGNKELTCAVAFRIRIWEFYGDKNYRYFDTNISMSGMNGCSGIEVVNTDNDSLLELLTIFTNPQLTWSSSIELYEFTHKSINPAYFSWTSRGIRQETSWYYSLASGDMDNDGLLDILLGYGQLWPPSPNILYYLEYDPVNGEFIPKYFSHPYPIDPSFCVIDDIDGDGLNEAFITGVGGGYGGILYLKSLSPDNYQILIVDSTSLKSAGSTVKTGIIDGIKYIIKADANHISPGYFAYYFHIIQVLGSELFTRYAGPSYPWETYIHKFEILDSDDDMKENIVFKISSSIRSLNDIEKTTISLISEKSDLPRIFHLLSNFPNPFNQYTNITFISNKTEPYQLIIYDVLGRKVWEKTSLLSIPGINRILWNGSDMNGEPLVSGIYYYQVKSLNYSQNHSIVSRWSKMVLIR